VCQYRSDMAKVRAKPHRLPREFYIGERTCAFTACCDERLWLFDRFEHVEPLIERLERAANQFQCVIPIYCFMPDHLHVMFKGLEGDSDMLAAMTQFKLLSGMWFHKVGLEGWQGNYHDHVVKGHEDWRSHATYIAQNPVRAGLVENPFDFPFTGTIGCDLQEIILGWGVDADGTFRRAKNF
jgi:putative transposase